MLFLKKMILNKNLIKIKTNNIKINNSSISYVLPFTLKQTVLEISNNSNCAISFSTSIIFQLMVFITYCVHVVTDNPITFFLF